MKIRHFLPYIAAAFVMVAPMAQAQEAAPATTSTEATATATPAVSTGTLQVSTKSAEAQKAYEMGLVEREDRLFVDEGLEFMREAVKADPTFALGHAALGYFASDPKEEHRESVLAIKNLDNASPDEQLLILWMNGTKNGEIVTAIAAMNDLRAKYPNDKRLANMEAEWLCSNQGVFDRGEAILEKVLKSDPRYFPAMNNLAYCYAFDGKAQLAPALMEQYVAILPNEPNPQDSYGEILRMLGNYPGALEHYQKALQINPNFNASQAGLASTYALMGDQKQARAQYLVAVKGTKEASTQLGYHMLWALTFYRENQPRRGREEMTKLAEEAQAAGFSIQEAEIYRTMALFNSDPAGAMKDLDAARATLAATYKLMQGDRDNELSSILQTRTFIAVQAGNLDAAKIALKPLTAMSQTSRSAPVQKAYHSANGAVLLAQGDYAGAISEFQEDSQNPLTLRLLSEAQAKAGQTTDAQKTLATLAAISDERIETAFAVPQARSAMKTEFQQTAQTGAH
ncbi:MAG TPA: tetratricopeptide repeat protein [Candidatus Acidoferrales bacterium]